MRLLLPPRLIAVSTAIALVALSSYLAMTFQEEEPHRGTEPVAASDAVDKASFIQGHVRVNLIGDAETKPLRQTGQKTSSDTGTGSDGARVRSGSGSAAVALPKVSGTVSSLMLAAQLHAGTQSFVGASIIIILLVCAIVLAYVMFQAVHAGDRWRGNLNSPGPVNKDPSYNKLGTGANVEPPAFLQQVIPPTTMGSWSGALAGHVSASPKSSGMKPENSAFGLRPYSSPMGSMGQLPSSSFQAPQYPPQYGTHPAGSATSLPAPNEDVRLPPPLCPNVVLPNCEVRVGVPMHELGKISSEGELTIVGLSGNPLLRAALRKAEGGRTLEISMPEPRSAPRATVGPAIQDVVGPNNTRSRAVKICGMKGAFYGMLEMRSTGACYVIKDGQTVLIIDGDSESLQLAIKSGQGLPLAAVTCSSEPFGGSEHLEIRVQPGVDTVLVLACVLSVVLLSPYPASD